MIDNFEKFLPFDPDILGELHGSRSWSFLGRAFLLIFSILKILASLCMGVMVDIFDKISQTFSISYYSVLKC
jgi:hypothetical protein